MTTGAQKAWSGHFSNQMKPKVLGRVTIDSKQYDIS